MSDGIYHSNQYCASNACEHCGEIVKHAPWCLTENLRVYYAYEIVVDSRALTEPDLTFLKVMHVAWVPEVGL